MSRPIVSVVVPVYNRSSALRPTVESVIGQTYEAWELVIIDDGSTDDTADVVSGYADPRIRYIRQENAGGAAARNRGVSAACGKYLAFLDHDDRWTPQKLEWQVEVLERHPEYGAVYGRIVGTNEADDDLGAVDLAAHQGWIFQHLLLDRNFLFTMSNPLMRAELVRQLNGLDTTADISDDWDLFLRLSQIAQFAYLDRTVVRYNFGNPQQQTGDVFRVYRSERKLLTRFLNGPQAPEPSLRKTAWRSFRRCYARALCLEAWRALQAREIRRARSCYLLAATLDFRSVAHGGVFRDVAALTLHTLGLRKLRMLDSTDGRHG